MGTELKECIHYLKNGLITEVRDYACPDHLSGRLHLVVEEVYSVPVAVECGHSPTADEVDAGFFSPCTCQGVAQLYGPYEDEGKYTLIS